MNGNVLNSVYPNVEDMATLQINLLAYMARHVDTLASLYIQHGLNDFTEEARIFHGIIISGSAFHNSEPD